MKRILSPKRLGTCLALSILLLLGGCYGETRMSLSLDGGQFFERGGYPSDLLIRQGRLDMSGFPKPGMDINPTLLQYRAVAERDFIGFAPDQTVYLKFDGDIADDDIRLPDDATEPGAAVQLVDIDRQSPHYGRRYALAMDFRARGDEYRPDNLLQVRVVDGFLRENNRYALLVSRAVARHEADRLLVHPVLHDLLRGVAPDGVSRQRASQALAVYQPLREFLADTRVAGLKRQDIIAATVWTTGRVTQKARTLADAVARWPQPQLNQPLTLEQQRENYCVYRSSWQVPQWQKGNFPYATPLDNGRLQLDAQRLTQHSERRSPVIITVPKQRLTEQRQTEQHQTKQLPVVFYHHGTDGRATQSLDRGRTLASGEQQTRGALARVAASQGWATAAMGGYMGADHQDDLPLLDAIGDAIPGLSLNIATYNFMNIQAMRDNLLQMLGERLLFRRLVNQLDFSTLSCGGGSAQGLDINKQVVMGQSLGAFTAGAQAAFDTQPLQAYVATGAGSYDLRLVMNLAALSDERVALGETLEPLFFWTREQSVINDPFHPLWAITDQILAPADFSYGLARQSHSSSHQVLPHRLFVLGHFDDWVGLPSQRKLLRAAQPDLVGNELELAPGEQLLPVIRGFGGEQRASAAANSPQGTTNAVVRYAEDGILSGHHVYFQQPDAHQQLACLLADIGASQVPFVAAGGSRVCFSE